MMKLLSTALAALVIAQVNAQTNGNGAFFVIYGKGTVTQRADPIVNPGSIANHVHEFAGSGSVGMSSNYQRLRAGKCASLGAANGSSINEDRSAYWHPSMYAKLLNGSFVRVPVIGRQIYYKNVGSGTPRQPFEFPKGFRMLAGSKQARAPLSHSPTNYDNITQWVCHGPVWNIGTAGGFPNNGVRSCPNYPFFNGAIHFPHCWNGKSFRLSDPTAHVSYPIGDIQSGPCPGTHPIRLPHIFMEIDYYLENLQGQIRPDSFVLSNGDPTGYSWHADFMNAWTPGTLPKLLAGSTPCYSHDVANCRGATFDFNYPWSSCSAKLQFRENVDGPFAALPGCNPISSVNPAPDTPVCSLGINGGTNVNVVKRPSTSKTTTKKSTTQKTTSTIQPTMTTTIYRTIRITKYQTIIVRASTRTSLTTTTTRRASTSTARPRSTATRSTTLR